MFGWLLILLNFFFYTHSQELSGSLELPTLGRPFTLGSLYDVCQDRLVAPIIKLRSNAALKKIILKKQTPYTSVAVLDSISFAEKARAFDIQEELKTSILSGLVNVSGAGT